jgi:TM2 domain-containing membrane protein YozV
LFAWLLPGAGHFYLRRPGKALVFLGAIGALFLLGVAMDSRLEMNLGLDDLLASLFSLAQMAIGLPYVVARLLGVGGDVRSVTFEYGNTFTAVAGLLNVLVVLDAYDTAVGRKR